MDAAMSAGVIVLLALVLLAVIARVFKGVSLSASI